MLESLSIAVTRWPLLKLRYVVGPFCFRANSLLSHAFNTIPNLSATIRVDGPFHGSLIIVNEESRGEEVLLSLLELIELDASSDGIGRTTSQVSLVID